MSGTPGEKRGAGGGLLGRQIRVEEFVVRAGRRASSDWDARFSAEGELAGPSLVRVNGNMPSKPHIVSLFIERVRRVSVGDTG